MSLLDKKLTETAAAMLTRAGWRMVVESTPSDGPAVQRIVLEHAGMRAPPILVSPQGRVIVWVWDPLPEPVSVPDAAGRLILA